MLTAFPLGVWLLFQFQTTQGLILALLGILSPIWGFLLYFGWGSPTTVNIRMMGGGVLAVLIGTLVWLAPDGKPDQSSPIHHRYSNKGSFIRLSPFNIIPEIEQMNVGTKLLGPLDPFIDSEKAERLTTVTLDIYNEMEADEHFKQLGSIMGVPMRQVAQIPYDNGHYFYYVPKSIEPGQPAPVLIYLHGAGGSFKAYQWIWRDFAEANGFVIISPTFGFGTWPEPAGSTAVLRALNHAATDGSVELDLQNVWLAGLSNGGLGTVHTAIAEPDLFQGLILISPALPSRTMAQPDAPFNSAWRDRPVLLIHGEKDARMPMTYLNQHIGFMQTGGVKLDTILYEDEDHFLFFAKRDILMLQVGQWIEQQNNR